MVGFLRIFFFLVLFSKQLFALSSLDLARNLVGNSSLEPRLKLLFEGKNYIDENGYARWDELLRILKMNALFPLSLSNSTSLELSFKARSDALIFVKIINEALNQAGFSYFNPTALDLSSDLKSYTVQIQTRYILDPASFYSILKQNFVFIKNIKRLGSYNFEYELDLSKAILKPSANILVNQSTNLQRPLRDYLIHTNGASKLHIRSNPADNWFAKVLFLDKNLRLIKSTVDSSKSVEFTDTIPNNAVYVIVGDSYNIDNIRRGLNIELVR